MEHEKLLDEEGNETTEDKAVMRVVSVYDDDGNLVEERFGALLDKRDQPAVS